MDCTFYKVGNGLFARIGNKGSINVYDCGSLSPKIIKGAVNNKFGRNNVIDYLFISHYDTDHVNGLCHLLTTNTVNHVILPMIPNLTRVVNYLSYPNNAPYSGFVLDPDGFIRRLTDRDTHIVHIGEKAIDVDDFSEGNTPAPPDIIEKGLRPSLNIQPSLVELSSGNLKFVPFNRRFMSDLELEGFLKELGLNLQSTTDDIIAALKMQNTNLKRALKKVFSNKEIKDLNDYSMTIMCSEANAAGNGCCLLTGDFNAKRYMLELKTAYQTYWDNICIMQMPHHGSDHSFHNGLCIQGALHIVSALIPNKKSRQQVDPRPVINKLKTRGLTVMDTINKDCNVKF